MLKSGNKPAECRVKKPESPDTEAVLLHLVRLALFPETSGDAESFSAVLSSATVAQFPIDWQGVYDLASRQTVRGVAWQGLSVLLETMAAKGSCPDASLPQDSLITEWTAALNGIERRNRLTDKVLQTLDRSFGKSGVRAVLKKGQSVARMYPVPEQRECGDIDLYIPDSGHRDKVAEMAVRNGCDLSRSPDGTIHFELSGVDVEIQSAFSDSRRDLPLSDILQEVPAADAPADRSIMLPSPEAELLMLSAHILKHCMGLGIGLRQICDMAVACRYHHGDIDPHHFRSLCSMAGLLRWNDLLFSFMVKSLGLPQEYLPYRSSLRENPDTLMRIIRRGGNFGRFAASRVRYVSEAQQPAPTESRHLSRRINTAAAFVRNLPFSLKYAPREWLHTVGELF